MIESESKNTMKFGEHARAANRPDPDTTMSPMLGNPPKMRLIGMKALILPVDAAITVIPPRPATHSVRPSGEKAIELTGPPCVVAMERTTRLVEVLMA